MEQHELSKIEGHIQAIKTAHAALADSSDTDELFQIIHRPGWTTPAEVAFLTTALESIQTQTRQLATMRQSLLVAAKLVSTSKAAGA
jgi:hypothetical protein